MTAPSFRRTARLSTYAAGGAALAVVLTACGGGSSPSSVSTNTGEDSTASASFTAVSGKVIAASASSAAVQETSGPQTVDFSSTTQFTSTASTTRSSLAKGDCVSAASTDLGTRNATRPTPGSTPSFPTSVTATSVTITSTSGCPEPTTTGQGGAPQPFPTASGFPGGGSGSLRGGFAGGVGGAFGGAFGTVTAISPSSFTVKSGFGSQTTITVTTTSATTYDAISTGSASDVKKGLCVNALGSDDVSGVLDARSVSISSPVDGTCPAARQFGGGLVRSGTFPGGPGGA